MFPWHFGRLLIFAIVLLLVPTLTFLAACKSNPDLDGQGLQGDASWDNQVSQLAPFPVPTISILPSPIPTPFTLPLPGYGVQDQGQLIIRPNQSAAGGDVAPARSESSLMIGEGTATLPPQIKQDFPTVDPAAASTPPVGNDTAGETAPSDLQGATTTPELLEQKEGFGIQGAEASLSKTVTAFPQPVPNPSATSAPTATPTMAPAHMPTAEPTGTAKPTHAHAYPCSNYYAYSQSDPNARANPHSIAYPDNCADAYGNANTASDADSHDYTAPISHNYANANADTHPRSAGQRSRCGHRVHFIRRVGSPLGG